MNQQNSVDTLQRFQHMVTPDRVDSYRFGPWLKSLRKSLDFTQHALAQRVGCTVATIRKIEADKLRPSSALAYRIADSLDIAREAQPAFVQFARVRSDQPSLHTPRNMVPLPFFQAHLYKIPTLPTSLVGRDDECIDIQASVVRDDVRLITVAGPPGIGKTHLTLQVAHAIQTSFTDGAVLVQLMPLHDADLVIPAIARALDIYDTGKQPLLDTLISFLADKHMLLVLDNFEHVISAASQLAHLLKYAPFVKILVTSRTKLSVQGEYEYGIAPLPVPDIQQVSHGADISGYAAVDLFVQRAQAMNPDFTLTAENAATIAAICVRLDGVPLAIELAATRIKLLSPQALLRRLHQRLHLLTSDMADGPHHHKTLRGAISWSYGLLSPDEQALFCVLGLFSGGCRVESLGAVIDRESQLFRSVGGATRYQDNHDVGLLNDLEALINHHLIQQVIDFDEESRFGMLETIREYAVEQLEAYGGMITWQRRYAHYYLSLAETAAAHLSGPDQAWWLDYLETEHDNMRAALHWSQSMVGDAHVGVRLATALSEFWYVRGYVGEGLQWFETVLEHKDSLDLDIWLIGTTYYGHLTRLKGDYLSATQLAEHSRGWAEQLQHTDSLARSLHILGWGAIAQHDYNKAYAYFTDSLQHFRMLNHQSQIANVLYSLGYTALQIGDTAQATQFFEEDLSISRMCNDSRGIVQALAGLGMIAIDQHTYLRAQTFLTEALTLARSLNYQVAVAGLLNYLGEVARTQSLYDEAMTYYAEAYAVMHRTGNIWNVALILHNRGHIALRHHMPIQAASYFIESLDIQQGLGNTSGIVICLVGLAGVATQRGYYQQAAWLLGAATFQFDKSEMLVAAVDRTEYDHIVNQTRTHLDRAVFDRAWSIGYAMAWDKVLVEARDVALKAQSSQSSQHTAGYNDALVQLTPREMEVLGLIAQGMTNRDIADQLVISPRTVNAHVTSIYAKLGVTSRSAATRLAVEHSLV
ncbi:MAG: LuxR C-terminal-related transcriptional regulator [Chloroflexota bacterium]